MSKIPPAPKDKRTKEYKDWAKKFKEDNPGEGLGDAVEKITTKTGIKKAVKWLAGEDCGCDERKEALNKVRIKVYECPTEEQFNWMQDYFKRRERRVQPADQKKIVEILNHTLKRNYKANSCGSCLEGKVNQLQRIYEAYL